MPRWGTSGRSDCPPDDGCSPEPMGGTNEPPRGDPGRRGGQKPEVVERHLPEVAYLLPKVRKRVEVDPIYL